MRELNGTAPRGMLIYLLVSLLMMTCGAVAGTIIIPHVVAQGGPDQVAETLKDLAAVIGEMQALHDLSTAGQVDMDGVVVEFSAEQKAALLDRYTTLKGRLADLFQQLP